MRTVRTRIRLIEPGDAEPLAAHLARDADALAHWEPERPAEYYTAAGQRRRIDDLLDLHRSGELWPGVVETEDGVIGRITAQGILRRAWQKAELGYFIAYPYQGQGHATRAVGLMVRLMIDELRLHRAEAFTQLDNLGSQHVLRTNGFIPIGIAREHIFTAGAWRDEILWEQLLDA
ncbi:MAG: GNAT family N-acetyltransferase [Microlunatus sp.]|nr:GNAT family N-acetyltransferase [Microlunatus sp.]